MPIQIQCPNAQCRQAMTCPDELAGQQASCPKCGTVVQVPAPQPSAAGSGRRLGDFSIVRKIGEGGMGAVYEAIQVGINRRVALKVLSPKLKEKPAFLERFKREARVAGALNHPNMVTVYEAGEAQGHHYLAMEFVDGETLRTRLKRSGKLPVDESLIIGRYVSEVIDYAWNHGKIIHRDIKPENIMLTREGHVKVADLGLAKSIEEDTTVTAVGAGIGTPAYMAPEQSQSARDVDCRADIYSLGITLFEMLTGQLPFQGDTPQAMVTAHLEQPLPDPRSLNPELPKGACDLLRRMCEKGAPHRYQTAAELIGDIDAVRGGGMPAASVPVASAVPVRRRRAARKSAAPMVLGLVLLLGLGGGLGYLLLNREKPGPEAPAGKEDTPDASAEPEAGKLFDQAVEYSRNHPTEYQELIERFEKVAQESEGTKYAALAREELRKVEEGRDEAAAQAWQKVKGQVEERLALGRLGEAMEILDSHRGRTGEAQSQELPELSKKVKDRALGQFNSVHKRATDLLVAGDYAAARTLYAEIADIGVAGVGERVTKELDKITQLESAAAARERAIAEEYQKEWRRVIALAGELRYQEALDRLSMLAKREPLQGLAERIQQDRSDLEKARSVYDIALAALPKQVGKPFSVRGIRGTLREVTDDEVVIEATGAKLSQRISALSAQDLGEIAAEQLGDRGPEGHVSMALFWAYAAGPDPLSNARASLSQARDAGVDVRRYEETCRRVESMVEEADAGRLLAKAETCLRQGKIEPCMEALAELEEKYGPAPFFEKFKDKTESIAKRCEISGRAKSDLVARRLVLKARSYAAKEQWESAIAALEQLLEKHEGSGFVAANRATIEDSLTRARKGLEAEQARVAAPAKKRVQPGPEKETPAKVNVLSMKPRNLKARRDGWVDIPDGLKGAAIYWPIGRDSGAFADIGVLKSGWVYLAMSWRPEGGGGEWQQEVWTKHHFLRDGWREHEDLELLHSVGERKYTILSKHCRAGDMMRFRCNKYGPPYVILLP